MKASEAVKAVKAAKRLFDAAKNEKVTHRTCTWENLEEKFQHMYIRLAAATLGFS